MSRKRGFTLIWVAADGVYLLNSATFFETLEEAQDWLDTKLAKYRIMGYVVTEKAVKSGQVVMWNLNVNGRDECSIGIVKGDKTPDDDDYTDW